MRIVYVVSLFPCWSETFIVREINELISAGVDVRIFSLKHASEDMVQTDAYALLDRVIYPQSLSRGASAALKQIFAYPVLSARELLRIKLGLYREPAKLIKSLVTWWRSLALTSQVRALRADRLHAHWATYPATAAQILAPRVGIPFSFTCHAHDIFVEDHFVASKLRQSQFAITISRFNIDFLAQRVGPVATEKLRVVHCGVEPEQIPFIAVGDPMRQNGLIVSVGRLDAIKGFESLVDACGLLAESGVAFNCVIVGEGPLRDALQARIDSAGLTAQIALPGAKPAEAVCALLGEAQVFVMPSRVTDEGDRDGIPVALMEAMAAGTPAVSTTVSGIPELIESGVHGLLVQPDDAPALADAIACQLAEKNAAAAMATAGRRRIEQEFNVSVETARLFAAFQSPDDAEYQSSVTVPGEGKA